MPFFVCVLCYVSVFIEHIKEQHMLSKMLYRDDDYNQMSGQYESLSADCVYSSSWPSQQTVACLNPSFLCRTSLITRSSGGIKKRIIV